MCICAMSVTTYKIIYIDATNDRCQIKQEYNCLADDKLSSRIAEARKERGDILSNEFLLDFPHIPRYYEC